MDNIKHRRLQELDRSDFEIVDGEPDIRGWDVMDGQERKIGEVEELIIDAQMKKVRYMVVEFDDEDLDLEDDRRVLIPIGLAELDKEDDDVILPNVTVEQLKALPAYDRDRLSNDTERTICSVLGRSKESMHFSASEEDNSEFYKHEQFKDKNLFRQRWQEDKNNPIYSQNAEFDAGLRLWELRYEGESTGSDSQSHRRRSHEEKEISEDARMEMVRNRRSNYEMRRNVEGRPSQRSRKDNSIERRIRDEGLRDG